MEFRCHYIHVIVWNRTRQTRKLFWDCATLGSGKRFVEKISGGIHACAQNGILLFKKAFLLTPSSTHLVGCSRPRSAESESVLNGGRRSLFRNAVFQLRESRRQMKGIWNKNPCGTKLWESRCLGLLSCWILSDQFFRLVCRLLTFKFSVIVVVSRTMLCSNWPCKDQESTYL